MTAPEAKYGAFEYGDALYGAGVPSTAAGTTEGSVTNSLRSTVVLGLNSTPETDLSQYGTNLTSAGGGVGAYETSSSRGAITSPRTLYVRPSANLGTDINATFLMHGHADASDYAYRIGLDGSGDIYFAQNASTLLTVAAADFTGGNTDLSIHWATRANPDTTIATNAMISEVVFYDHTNSSYHHYPPFTHAVATADTADTLSVGGYWDGATLQQALGPAPASWRVDGAYYSHTHFSSHWVENRTGASSVTERTLEPTAPTRASGVGDADEYTGPVLQYVNAHQREAFYRFLSPLVNECYTLDLSASEGGLTNSYAPAGWHYKPPGSTVYRWQVAFLRWCTVPDNCNYVQPRVFFNSVVSSGASVPIGIRVYSFSRPPMWGKAAWNGEDPPEYDFNYVQDKIDIDHTADGNEGDWATLGLLKIVRPKDDDPKWRDTSFFCIAYAIDPDSESANDAAETLTIRSFSLTPAPFFDDNGNGGGIGLGG